MFGAVRVCCMVPTCGRPSVDGSLIQSRFVIRVRSAVDRVARRRYPRRMFVLINSILDSKSLAQAKEIVSGARFIGGEATGAGYTERGVKRNLEMEVTGDYLTLIDLLNKAVDDSAKLNGRILPRYRVNPIVNRYDEGMFYRRHVDAPIQGGVSQIGRVPGRFGQNFVRTDYSMTLFLSDPETYDGGELELELDDSTHRIKLPAGSAVCYATGIGHSVLPVRRGSRVCAIYWFQSMIRDVHLRRVLWDQAELAAALVSAGKTELAEKAENVRLNLIRYLAEI